MLLFFFSFLPRHTLYCVLFIHSSSDFGGEKRRIWHEIPAAETPATRIIQKISNMNRKKKKKNVCNEVDKKYYTRKMKESWVREKYAEIE